ncbi:MAG: DUF3883 domain-containing protein [Nitratireductor sp.]
MAGEDWSPQEIDAIVADYFSMLSDELADLPFNKAERNRGLRERIDRSRGSIEFKHQNISAVMLGLGQPWITGYKPAANFQNALVDGVLRWLDANEQWLLPRSALARMREGQAVFEGPRCGAELTFGPSPSQRNEPPPIDSVFLAALARKYDVAERDARNRELGRAGEELVLEHERRWLHDSGRDDLSAQVRWTAVEDGDGFGYDIASFAPNGRERLIEVKTTRGWNRTPFHVTRNELRVAEAERASWELCRVWDFARTPKAFVLQAPLEQHAELTPTSFLASLL